MVLIGNCQSSRDSTTSTPKVLRKVIHKVAETERKAFKTNFTADLGTNSAPPYVKTKNEGKRKMDDLKLNRVRKKSFFPNLERKMIMIFT